VPFLLPLAFYPTLALATPDERGRFEINDSSVYRSELNADIGAEGVLAARAGASSLRPQSRGARHWLGAPAEDRAGELRAAFVSRIAYTSCVRASKPLQQESNDRNRNRISTS
jgi:hypothetical protein